MKFQNCILVNLNGCTDELKAICPFNFSKVGGIKTTMIWRHLLSWSIRLFQRAQDQKGSSLTLSNSDSAALFSLIAFSSWSCFSALS